MIDFSKLQFGEKKTTVPGTVEAFKGAYGQSPWAQMNMRYPGFIQQYGAPIEGQQGMYGFNPQAFAQTTGIYPTAPEPFNIPSMPDVSGVTGIPSQMLENLWSTWMRRPEYQSPEYQTWREMYPGAEAPAWAETSGWGEHDPSVIQRHVEDVWGMSPEQAYQVGKAFGLYPGGLPPPKPEPEPIPPEPIPPGPIPPEPEPEPTPIDPIDYNIPDIPRTPTEMYGSYPPVENAPFPYPEELGIASQVLSRHALGLPTAVPRTWQTAADVATDIARGGGLPTPVPEEYGIASEAARNMLAQGGMPVDISGWWEAQQAPLERSIREQSQQLAEEAGLAGLRWSTPLQRQIADVTSRAYENLWADLAGREISAQEAARGRMMETVPQLMGIGTGIAGLSEAAKARQMEALPQLYQLGAGTAGLTEAAKQRGLSAAMALPGIAQQYFDMPMNWAAQMMGMGGQMQGLSQAALDRLYQEFLRTTPEASPWMQQMYGYLGIPSQQTYQQYQPSFLSQLLGLGSMAIPFL